MQRTPKHLIQYNWKKRQYGEDELFYENQSELECEKHRRQRRKAMTKGEERMMTLPLEFEEPSSVREARM